MDGPFNVGTLIATLRLEGHAQFRSDLAAARSEFQAVGRSAKESGSDVERGQRQGAKATSDAAASNKAAASQSEAAAKTVTRATEDQTKATDDTAKATQTAAEKAAEKARQQKAEAEATARSEAQQKAYNRSIREAGQSLDGLRPQLRRARDEWTSLDETQQGAVRDVSGGLAIVSGAVFGLAATAVARFASFDAAMSSVRANVGGTADDMRLLEQAAIEAGGATQYTAEEAAKAQNELGKAGVSTAAILSGGLRGALNLAASGQIEVADAAETAATAMTQFRLSGDQVPHLADLLAAGAAKAQGGVIDLSYALRQSGLVASQFGLSVEDTIGGLTAFASAGLLGSDAGTSFRTMLLSLANPSARAREEMAAYNIEAYDAQGNFVGLAELAEQLKTGFAGATQAQRDQALATIFGTDAIRGANVLYQQGADGIERWTDAVDESGFAQKQAAELTNNLNGDIERLGGSLDSAMIIAGQGANGPLRDLVQMITALIDGYTDLPAPVQQAGLIIGGVVGVAGLAAAAFLAASVQVSQLRANMKALNGVAPSTRAALSSVVGFLGGPWGVAIFAATAILGTFIDRQMDIKASTDAIVGSLDTATGAVTDYTREIIAKKLAESGAFDAAREAGVSQKTLTDAIIEGGDALERVQSKIGENNTFGSFFSGVGIRAGKASSSIRDLRTAVEDSEQSFIDQKAATEGTTEATEAAAAANGTLAEELVTVEGVTREVTEAEAERIGALQEADASFVGLGEAMTGVQDRSRELAEQTAADTETSKDSWEDYYDGVTVSTEGILEELRKQVEAQTNWEANMLALSSRASQGVIDELTRLGPEGAPLVAELVTASDEQLAELETLFAEKSAAATGAWADALTTSAPVLAALAAVAGQGTADEMARKLAEGTTTLQEIVNQWGLAVEGYEPEVKVNAGAAAEELRRLQMQLDNLPLSKQIEVGIVPMRPGVAPSDQFQQYFNQADGGVVDYYAHGGVREHHVAQIANAGAWRVWAEPETGGEAYIPLSVAKRNRSEAILDDVARRFGGQYLPPGARAFADGATVGGPQVRSVGRGGPYIGGDVVLGQGVTGATLDQLLYYLRTGDRGGPE